MDLNWTTGVIVAFISLIPSTLATMLTMIQYFKDRYNHLKYLTGMWVCLTIWILFQAISDLYLSIPLHFVCFYALIVMSYFANLFVDSVTRDSIDLFKMIITTVLSSAVILLSILQADAVIIKTNAISEYPTMNGDFRTVTLLQMIWLIVVAFYGNLKVFLHTPKHLKFYSFLNVFGNYFNWEHGNRDFNSCSCSN